MTASNLTGKTPTEPGPAPASRVTTIISCPGVVPLSPDNQDLRAGANENRWFDRIGFRRRWRANIAAGLLTLALLIAGVWIALEFVRLQKIAACYEAGRRNCTSLNMDRRGP